MLGVCVIGSVVQRNVQSMVEARQQVAEAVAAVGAAHERARLARDMHDSVGKSIHGISLGAKALRRMVDRDPDQAKELAGSLADAADQAAREARALLMSLREGQIDRPTVDVVSEILADWQAETGIGARLVDVAAVDAEPGRHRRSWSPRCGRSCTTSPSTRRRETVEVALTGDPERIELAVTDDGVGFDVDRAAAREADGHFGLRGLRERAEQVGGAVEITFARSERGPRSDGQHNDSGRPEHHDEDRQGDDPLEHPEEPAAVRVGIADDNAVVRMGIRSLLATADDIVVVGEAGDGAAAVTLARTAKPDVMLLDVRMPRQDGVSAAPRGGPARDGADAHLLRLPRGRLRRRQGRRPRLPGARALHRERAAVGRPDGRPRHRHLLRPGRGGAVQPDAEQGRPGLAATGCRSGRPT